MLLVVLLLVSKAGAVCVGGPQDLRTGEVLVMCPLSEDVRLTRRSVIISHSSHAQSIPDNMLGCDWLAKHSQTPNCSSRFHFTLVSLHKDCVMARVPRAQLRKDGFYQCQLVPPPDEEHVFSRCLVYDNDDMEDPSRTISHVIPSTADDLRHPGNDKEKVSTSADGGSQSGNYTASATLSVSLVTFIVLISGFCTYILLHKRYGRRVLRGLWNYMKREKQPRGTLTPTSETSLENEQHPLMQTVPGTPETFLKKEQKPIMKRSASFGEKETQPRYLIPERMIASDVSRSHTLIRSNDLW